MADFVWRIEDVLDLYAEPYATDRPVVCFDELRFQLLIGKRTPRPVAPSHPHGWIANTGAKPRPIYSFASSRSQDRAMWW